MAMRSLRLSDALDRRMRQAAERVGQPVSQFIRDAIAAHCDRLVDRTLEHRLEDLIGVVESGGGRAERSGDAYRDLLRKSRSRKS